jgi:hypothetical protein
MLRQVYQSMHRLQYPSINPAAADSTRSRACHPKPESRGTEMNKTKYAALLLICALPVSVVAQQSSGSNAGPSAGDREFSISGTGSSDKRFKSGTFGVTGDYGHWYDYEEAII